VQFYRPTLLDFDEHQRDGSTYGEPTLDEWLRRYASQDRRGNSAAVGVIADGSYTVVFYATLSMTSVDQSASAAPLAKGAPTQVPASTSKRRAELSWSQRSTRPPSGSGSGSDWTRSTPRTRQTWTFTWLTKDIAATLARL
jgi:hypothetical protein